MVIHVRLVNCKVILIGEGHEGNTNDFKNTLRRDMAGEYGKRS